MEDVSDWLTKMLVGVGLSQIAAVAGWLSGLGEVLGPGLGDIRSSAALGIGLVIYYTSTGFLFGFILTRRYLPGLFYRGEQELRRMYERFKKEIQDMMSEADLGRTEDRAYFVEAVVAEERSASKPGEADAKKVLDQFAADYANYRKEPAGPERTFKMDRLVAEVRKAATTLELSKEETEEFLDRGHGTDGRRVVALALAQVQKKREFFPIALDGIKASRSAFELYHALRALTQMVNVLSREQKLEACRAITDRRRVPDEHQIKPGTDRWALSEQLRAPDKLNCEGIGSER